MRVKKRWLVLALALGFGLSAPLARGADTEGDEKKNEKDLKKAEEAQGKGDEHGELDELEAIQKILELMRGAEDRLAESDTGQVTQAEQKKIVEAMKFGGKARTELDRLIEHLENCPT